MHRIAQSPGSLIIFSLASCYSIACLKRERAVAQPRSHREGDRKFWFDQGLSELFWRAGLDVA
jgi:hypothetical protein